MKIKDSDIEIMRIRFEIEVTFVLKIKKKNVNTTNIRKIGRSKEQIKGPVHDICMKKKVYY